jgi:membrane-bound lytic murein transglycosylase MltF
MRVSIVAALALAAVSCSKPTVEEKREPAGAAVPSSPVAAKTIPEAQLSDDFPPIVRDAWKGDLDEMAKRRVIRVLLPYRTPDFFFDDTKPAGVLWEAFREIERLVNAKYKTNDANRIIVAYLPTPIHLLEARMAGGYGDIAAYGISITDERRNSFLFTNPTMRGLKIVVVTGPAAPPLNTVDDLSGKEIWVQPVSRMKADVEALNKRLKEQGKEPAKIRETDPVLQPGDMMEMVNAGAYPIVAMQSHQAQFWAAALPDAKVRMDLSLADDIELGWALQKESPKLKAFLDDFLRTHGLGTSFGNTVFRRYFQNAAFARKALDPGEFRNVERLMPSFRKYSQEYNLDALMLIAQGYQESRLDQKAKSHAGAVGVMQVLPSTAASSPVKVPNIEQEENNIHAGTRLMNYLIKDYFDEPDIDLRNRMLFAMASYNAGPAKIQRCRKLAREMGYDSNRWFGNVEVAVAKVVGRETTQYVANIYKYYLAYQLVMENRQLRDDAVKRAAQP